MGRTSLVIRSLFLLGFVIAMPLLALPSVARWADEYLYGEGDAADHRQSPVVEEDTSEHDRAIVQAVLESPLPRSPDRAGNQAHGHGLDSATAQPPAMPPSPEFPAPAADAASNPSLDLRFDPSSFDSRSSQDSSRIEQIRQRLEDLGADYIRLEADSQTGQYHCHCRMLVAPQSTETRSFEATNRDATAALEQVLQAVDSWRTSLSSPAPVQ